eukprot:4555235-Karenia_brevis.AAC.1
MGHVTHASLLGRHLLSVFQHIYKFVDVDQHRRKVMPPAVREEIWMVAQLIFLTGIDLAARFANRAYIGDSSTHGFCFMRTAGSQHELYDIFKWREKWRFHQFEPDELHPALSSEFIEWA